MAEKGNKPVYKIRDGGLNVTVWKNERDVPVRNGKGTEKRTFYSMDVKRSYKDGDEWKDTPSIDYQSAPRAAALLMQAYAAVVDIRAKAAEPEEE